jgi:glycosyltransferase involved in cell wall biosynthesis
VRILFLHQFDLDLAGGSGTYLRLLTAPLIAAGHCVEVVAARGPDRYGLTTYALPFDFTLTFGPQRRAGERTFDDFSIEVLQELATQAAASLEEQAFGAAPDLLLVNHVSLTAAVAHLLASRHDVPYRVISYGTDTQLLLQEPRYVDWLRAPVEQAESVFAISEFVAGQLRGLFPSTPVTVSGGAVDTTVFHPVAQTQGASRIVFVGRLVSEKGVDTLLEALDLCEQHVTLDVVGEGPLGESLREAAGERVNVLGYLPSPGVREVLAGAAALVVPSLWEEPLGLVVLEAMACGVPVIATAVGGIPEIVQHGRNGLLVRPGDSAGLAQAIDRVVGDPSLRARLRDHCLMSTEIPSQMDLAARLVGER